MNFNSELIVNEKALNGMKDVAIEFAHACVMECSRRYEFDGEEAVKLLGLRNPLVKTKITKEKRVQNKPKYTFPYNGERNMDVCQGLILNGGLFTQCEMSKKTQLYCGKCSKQAEKNSHGTPNYGTIMDRNSVGIMEYIDPSGKCPVSYLKFINKKKWNLEEVQEEAKKYSININEIHFVEEISTKKRGRKPRVRAQVACDTDDEDESSQDNIFDTIIETATSEDVDENPPITSSNDDADELTAQFSKLEVKSAPPVIVVEEVPPPQAPTPVVQVTPPQAPAPVVQVTPMEIKIAPPVIINSAADLEEIQNEEVKVAPQEEQTKKLVKKTDKNEKLKLKEIEKQRKIDEKNAAAAAKEMEKKKKEEEAKAKKAETSNSKNSKLNVSKKTSNSTEKTSSNSKADMFCTKGKEPCMVAPPAAKAPTPKKAAEPSVSVKPFTHNGVKYYKSTDNILYDKDGNPQGTWDETNKTINPIIVQEEEEAEEEEEDDEDDDDNSEEEEEEYEEEEAGSARYTSINSDLLDEIEYYECLGSD